VGVATLIAGLGICIYDACVDKCFAVLDQAISAEPPPLPEWASMRDNELLERIPSTSATNIEAGLRDRVRELRDRGMTWVRIGAALDMMRQSA
jgi:ATP-dependent Clp protease ATP-binding subunit ClpX